MNKELEFLEEKYGHNSWNNYPPSKQQVAQWLKEYTEKQFAISGVMHPLPDLKSKSLPLFLEEYKNLASKDVLTKVWEYGNNQWENGYIQGKYNPDFD